MRPLALATLLAVLPALAGAEDAPDVMKIEVGKEVAITGYRALCDDPSIAIAAAEGGGTLRALKVGETTCSWSIGSPLGLRRIVKVVVVPPPRRDDGKGGDGGQRR